VFKFVEVNPGAACARLVYGPVWRSTREARVVQSWSTSCGWILRATQPLRSRTADHDPAANENPERLLIESARLRLTDPEHSAS
jgi:hypothetical protein